MRRVEPCCTVRGPDADLSCTIDPMASIRTKQLTNGKSAYLVRFRTADGHERSRQFARRRDAEHFAHLTEVDRAQGSFVDPRLGKITVAEWFERWWPTVTNLRPTTRARDEASYRTHIAPAFGSMQLARVDRTSAREWVARLSDPDDGALAPATVAKAAQVFNKLMRAAVEDRVIASNPIERLPLPRIEREEMRFLSADELWRLADAIDPRYRALIVLAGYSGLRLGELLALRWEHVDTLRRRVTVVETLTDLAGHISFGPPKTRAALRTISVPAFVIEELAQTPDGPADPRALVFTSPEGQPVRPTLFRRRYWAPAVTAAGLSPLRIHDLRHTAVALWIAAAAHPKQVAARAGHTSVSVVLDRYGHLLPDHDAELIRSLELHRA
jgi:integrase